jgi:N-acetylmuramic acid 6-phosphate (MurNAc-6-P) etherase
MLNPFVKSGDPHMLVVGMAGVKMGDRLIQIGCEHGGRLGAVAAKVGFSGRAVAIVPDERAADRARKGAADAGVLVEVDVAPPTRLTADDQAFDLAVVDDTGGLVGARPAAERTNAAREIVRVLRPGGRLLYIGAVARSGMAGLFGKVPEGSTFAASPEAIETLMAGGFKSVRNLAEREGLIFLEGIKPR